MNPQANEVATQVPFWLSYYGSIAGFIAVILQITFALYKLCRVGKLEIKLTRDVFFRVTEWGESVFANALLIARHDVVEIRKVEFNLKKISPVKDFPLFVLWVGNKKEGSGPFAENNFYAKSEICFITKDSQINPIYIAVLDDYDSHIKNKMNEFTLKMLAIKPRYEDYNKSPNETVASQLFEEFMDTVNSTHAELIDKIQLESGNYNLNMKVNYCAKFLIFKIKRNNSSSISFNVASNARELLKAQLRKTLEETGRNYAFGQNNDFTYPEYSPEKVKEL